MHRWFFGFVVLACATVWGAEPSAAQQWFYSQDDSAFGTGGKYIAVTANGMGYGFGLRCIGSGPEVLYTTTDQSLDREQVTQFNTLFSPSILVRVDNGEVMRIKGQFVLIDTGLAVLADAPDDLAPQIRDAKRRISVAIEAIDIMHESKFGVRGSTKAISQWMADCGSGNSIR